MSAAARTEPEQSAPRSDRRDPAETNGDAVLMEWTVRLAQREPGRVAVVIAAMALSAAAGLFFFNGSIVFGLAGPLLILSSTAEYLLPYRNRITKTQVGCGYGLSRYEITWKNVVRAIPMPGGVKLSPLPEPSRLDAFRGVLLRFAPDGQPGDKTSVMRIVEEKLKSDRVTG